MHGWKKVPATAIHEGIAVFRASHPGRELYYEMYNPVHISCPYYKHLSCSAAYSRFLDKEYKMVHHKGNHTVNLGFTDQYELYIKTPENKVLRYLRNDTRAS